MPSPGPGHYEVVDYSDPVKYQCSGAVFLSATSRYDHDWSHDEHPGPGGVLLYLVVINAFHRELK